MSPPILIMAGGTGGHVYPALAVANALRARARDVVWLGTRRGLEARVVPDAGIEIEWISVSGLRGKGAASWLAAPFRLLVALAQALRVMRRRRPAAVLGMGGFVSGPGGVAAGLGRRPLVIHEQNAVAGATNRLLARRARVVLEAFPGTFPPSVGARTVGNPVRDDIGALPPPAERYAGREGALRLLVLGGSQGALALNLAVPAALAALAPAQRPLVRHQAGAATLEAARAAYRDAGLRLHRMPASGSPGAPAAAGVANETARAQDALAAGAAAVVVPYIDDMSGAYGWADLVVCRAGALTVAELCAAGLPAVLVPYPSAVDDHQAANARALVEAGAALLLRESALTPARLAAAISELGADRAALVERAAAARTLAAPAAVDTIADTCLAVAGEAA